MKHRATKILLFPLLGAILNIAIAWTCVLNPWHAKEHNGTVDLEPQVQWWRRVAPPDMSEPTRTEFSHLPGADQIVLNGQARTTATMRPNEGLIEQTIRVRAGLPMQSLHGDVFIYVRVSSDNMTAHRFDSLMGPPPVLISKKIQYQRPMLPLAPLWPGFAINTIFYAAILEALFALPFSLRRRRRIKRGLCPACAYDLRGNQSVTCPECGKQSGARSLSSS